MPPLLLSILIALSWVPPSGAATPTQIKEVARELVCLCGDCNRESLATCLCSFAQAQRQELAENLDAGKARREIIRQFVDQYGQIVLASPPPQGYNLLAWIVPIAMLVFGVAVVRSVLIRWRRGHATSQNRAAAAAPPGTEKTAEYQDKLRRELDHFDTR